MKKKTKNNEDMIYKSPFLRAIVFIFFVFIPFQLFLVYFIQLLNERIHSTQKKEKIIKIPTQTVTVTTPPKPAKPIKKAAAPKKAAATSQDDLQLISGIGPKTREAMNEQGISSYAQIASMSLEGLNQVLESAGLRIKASQSWIDQANQLK
jgi:predicted flap endonuclease-1-like 5' DNA nuclease